MSEFVSFLQDKIGASYPLRDMIDNLNDDEILCEIEEYSKSSKYVFSMFDERNRCEYAIAHTKNLTKAAELFGCSQRNFYRIVEKHGLQPRDKEELIPKRTLNAIKKLKSLGYIVEKQIK